jgi:carboxyl-terminal processing protease
LWPRLQDHQRAIVVGERFHGRGSVQNIIEMESRSSAEVDHGELLAAQRQNIHRFPEAKEADEWGVKPDAGFEVTLKDDERRRT